MKRPRKATWRSRKAANVEEASGPSSGAENQSRSCHSIGAFEERLGTPMNCNLLHYICVVVPNPRPRILGSREQNSYEEECWHQMPEGRMWCQRPASTTTLHRLPSGARSGPAPQTYLGSNVVPTTGRHHTLNRITCGASGGPAPVDPKKLVNPHSRGGILPPQRMCSGNSN